MTTQRLYTEMSAEEQALWVQDFAQVMEQGGERLMLIARGKGGATTVDDATTVRRMFDLLGAWSFAQDFCEKARRYGDYMARASRLPVYIEKVKEKLSEGLTMTDGQGRVVAYVSPSAPMRRRGRPTKEEVAARLRGGALSDNGQGCKGGDDAEARKRRTIARMLGLEVVVSGEAPREKNNAELKAERDARRAREEKMNPSLFGAAEDNGRNNDGGGRNNEITTSRNNENNNAANAVTPCAQLMSDSYEMRMAQDKLHLNQLAWMLSPELAKRTETVQSLRVTAESASERAKLLAEQGADAKAIEPYAQQAKEATEAYLAIYQAVDEELAIVFYRLQNDEPFREKFVSRFRGVDLVRVSHICRPYYEKLRTPELDLRIKTIIEQESPEYAAKMRAEQAKKEEVADILRYLKRKDKDASDTRLKTAKEVKFPRLVELIGEEEAKDYLPLISYIEEENRKWREANGKDEDVKDDGANGKADNADKKPKKTSKQSNKETTNQESKQSRKQKIKKKDER